ncbi:MAG: hypothetical protein EOO42_03795, partial [Flavobacteriales bacterium]
MKKHIFLLLVALCTTMASYAQSGWVTTKVDERISVKFPEEPTKSNKKGSETFIVKAKDSVQYSATIIDFTVIANLDSVALAPMKDMPQFADQLVAGIASQKPNYEFGEVKIGKWKGHTSYTFSGVDKTNKAQTSIEMILIGNKMYTLTCKVPDQLVTKNKELFLSSVTLL